MTTETYTEFNPGDLITAEGMNEMQDKIKKDIEAKVAAAKEEIVNGEVAQAGNALKFDAKTPDGWIEKLMEIFAVKQHDHEGVLSYQRYFLELETVLAGTPPRQQPVVIIHDMGRQPLVQVYELLDLVLPATPPLPPGVASVGFAFCGPEHADPVLDNFMTQSWDERHWGNPIDVVVRGLARSLDGEQRATLWAEFQDNFTLGAWLTNLEKRLFEPGPGQYHFDVGDTYRTEWIVDRIKTQVKKLKEEGEWPPRFVYRPVLLDRSGQPGPANADPPGMPVDVFHLNMNEIEIQVYSDKKPIRLMVLLRG